MDFDDATIGTRRKRLFWVLTIVFPLLTAVVFAEIAVRALFRYNTPDTIRRNSLNSLPSVYGRHVLKPNQRVGRDKAWGVGPGSPATGRVYVINENGFRGPPVPHPKPGGGVAESPCLGARRSSISRPTRARIGRIC